MRLTRPCFNRDFQKLIFYYYADHYINFKDLITDLYRIYKTRIWLSAVNPASFSQHAMGQPPSGIGPGAITGMGQDNSYTMAYGSDPDPYGAVPPYRIGYDTYTPNYPGIPGVPNSFEPATNAGFAPTAPQFQPMNDSSSIASGQSGGGLPNYNFFYNRNGGLDQDSGMSPSHAPSMPPIGSASGSAFNPYMPQYQPNMYSPNPPNPSLEGRGGADSLSSYQPWNTGLATNQSAAGQGRNPNFPMPIGTRPSGSSNGSSSPIMGGGGGFGLGKEFRPSQDRLPFGSFQPRAMAPDNRPVFGAGFQ